VGGDVSLQIRGRNSIQLGTQPIVIVDGIRYASAAAARISLGSVNFVEPTSPLNDLNPDEIESIEIVKGPSAATLYGTDAANGVILITTKKGRAGATRWNGWGEGGVLKDFADYPYNYTIAGHSAATPTTYRECTLSQVSAFGNCIMDSLRVYSPLHDADATPIGLGYRSKFGGNVQGGTEALRFFVSGEREDEMGMLKLPDFEKRRLDAANTPIDEWTLRPNDLYKYSFRANLNASVTPKLDLAFTGNLIHLNSRFF